MLKQRDLSMLWGSQVLSAIGDQLHSLAVLWIAVQIGGPKAGLVAASGTTAGTIFGLFAGVYADRLDRRVAMIVVDVLRAAAVLLLAIVAQLGDLQLWQLGLVAVAVSTLGSLFNPCMSASLPALVEQPELLRAMTALMMMTFRIARLIGPGIAGLLLAYCPVSTFFVIDSATYVVSAVAIWSLGSKYLWRPKSLSKKGGLHGIRVDLALSTRVVLRHRQLAFALAISSFEPGLWCAAYLVGLPLLIKQGALGLANVKVTDYAVIICAYGCGNVLSLLCVGTHELARRCSFFIGLGLSIMGLGFVLLSSSGNLIFACIAAAFAATGGPVSDMAMTTLLQKFPAHYRGKLSSLRSSLDGLSAAIGLTTASFLFATVSSTIGIALCGSGILILGLVSIICSTFVDKNSVDSKLKLESSVQA